MGYNIDMLFDNPDIGTMLFTPQVIKIFRSYKQSSSSLPEAGGYLIGEQFRNQLVITVATTPGKGDVSEKNFFQRSKERGQKLLNRIWKLSRRRMFLV